MIVIVVMTNTHLSFQTSIHMKTIVILDLRWFFSLLEVRNQKKQRYWKE